MNHIKAEKGWPHSAVTDVVNVWRDNLNAFLPRPEDVRFSARYVIPDKTGAFLGRLTATLTPAFLRKSGEEILILTMVARGRPVVDSIDGALEFLDLGHDWIVQGFTGMTTAEMHKRWGRVR